MNLLVEKDKRESNRKTKKGEMTHVPEGKHKQNTELVCRIKVGRGLLMIEQHSKEMFFAEIK